MQAHTAKPVIATKTKLFVRYTKLFGLVLPSMGLLACADLGLQKTSAPQAQASVAPQAYVVLGEQGQTVARVLTASACPALEVDGKLLPMQMRAPANTAQLRKTVFSAEQSKPSVFPLNTCELPIAVASKSVKLGAQALPLPAAEITRIVVLGDSGCRIRGDQIQACNDADQFPFAKVAQAAANWKPQLVLHVGDYHYRESACPANNPGCAGSPWGYGWDTWQADFFAPAQPLLQAAPWVMVRGNHESCRRAGQGWWRLLDPRPLQAGRDCNLEKDDITGDYSEPYAVPLGNDAQLLILDSAAAPHTSLKKDDVGFAKFSQQYTTLERLANQATYNMAAFHHPLLGIYVEKQADGKLKYYPGNQALQSVFLERNAVMLPPRIQTLLAGHVHTWQQLSFSSGHPSHFISGIAGSALDPEGLPAQLPPDVTPALSASIENHDAYSKGFGFMTMERDGASHWQVKLWDVNGKQIKSCEIDNRASVCKK